MESKQDNYLRMHHPSIYKGMKKGGKVEDYKKGGKVACFAQGGRNTDTVPAMLTPGEVVLNQDQQERLGNMMAGGGKAGGGQARAAALFKHMGVPGYQDGKKITYDDKMPHGMYQESKMVTIPWDKPKRELMEKASLQNYAELPQQPPSPLMPKEGVSTSLYYDIFTDPRARTEGARKKLFSREKIGGGRFSPEYEYTRKAEGGLIDKKDVLMAYYMGGRV